MKRLLILSMIMTTMLVGCGNSLKNTTSGAADTTTQSSSNDTDSSQNDNDDSATYSGEMSEEEVKKAEAKDIQFECISNGKKIRGAIRTPENFDKNTDTKYPVAILSHGILGDRNQGRLFSNLADTLEKKNIVSVRFDFDGYGQSEGTLVDNSIKTECDDLKSVIEYVKTLDYIDTDKVNLVGFSMGGAATSIVAGELKSEIHSVSLWSAAAVLVDDCEKGHLMDATVDVNNLPDEVPIFNGQYTFGKAFFKDAIGLDIYGTAKQFTGPVLILQGDKDTVVPMSYSEKYNEVYENSKLEVIENGEHVYSGDPLKKVITLTTKFLTENN